MIVALHVNSIGQDGSLTEIAAWEGTRGDITRRIDGLLQDSQPGAAFDITLLCCEDDDA